MVRCLTFRHACIFASLLPPLALIICVILCISTHSCIATHCTESNILPSLSAAVGDDEPQKTIWCISIFSSSAWRFVILVNSCINFWTFFNIIGDGKYLWHAALLCFSSSVEIFALNMLTLWSSSTNFIQHRNSFCIFVLFSVIYMTTDVYLSHLVMQLLKNSLLGDILKTKTRVFVIYITCLLVIMSSYYVHITYCPPYAYTVFAAFEYVAIFANVAYHYTAARIYEDMPISEMINYFSTGRTVPLINMKPSLPLYK
ncbi:unnamed protein product [Trichobilharzia szidati]|nr:unnamed protein product [Trichobilharzia szidati]